MLVKLYGRSHPAHNAARMVYHTDHKPFGCQGIKELKGPSRGHGRKGLNVKGFISLQVLGLQGSRGSSVNCEVQGFRRSPIVDCFKISYPRVHGSEGQGVSRHLVVYL